MAEKDGNVYVGEPMAYRIAVEEMKFRMEQQFQALDIVKTTARQILSSASLILALAGVLQVINGSVADQNRFWFNLVLGLGGIAYLVLIVLCITCLRVVYIDLPIAADWDVIYESYIQLTDEVELLRMQLSSYLNVIALNTPVVKRKSRLVNLASWFLPITVLLLFAASWLHG